MQASKTIRTKARGGRSQALDELRAFVAEVSKAEARLKATAPFSELVDDWLRGAKSRGTKGRRPLAQTTLETYTEHIERRIRPQLGEVPIGKLTAHHLDRGLDDLRELHGALVVEATLEESEGGIDLSHETPLCEPRIGAVVLPSPFDCFGPRHGLERF